MSQLPDMYFPAVNRCVTATDGEVIGVAWVRDDGTVVRLSLDVDDAETTATEILRTISAYREAVRTNVQPAVESGMPSAAVSPQDGVKV